MTIFLNYMIKCIFVRRIYYHIVFGKTFATKRVLKLLVNVRFGEILFMYKEILRDCTVGTLLQVITKLRIETGDERTGDRRGN